MATKPQAARQPILGQRRQDVEETRGRGSQCCSGPGSTASWWTVWCCHIHLVGAWVTLLSGSDAPSSSQVHGSPTAMTFTLHQGHLCDL
jgi:hypothetical protein